MSEIQNPNKILNVSLWVTQILLSTSFIWAASLKLMKPNEELAEMWPWVAGNDALVKFTGLVDLIAGLGLILPALFKVQPKLTVYAAYGTIALMIAASIFHVSRGEGSVIVPNIIFAIFAAFIAWGRKKR